MLPTYIYTYIDLMQIYVYNATKGSKALEGTTRGFATPGKVQLCFENISKVHWVVC